MGNKYNLTAGPSLRIRRLGSGNEKRPVIKSKRIFFLKSNCQVDREGSSEKTKSGGYVACM